MLEADLKAQQARSSPLIALIIASFFVSTMIYRAAKAEGMA